MLSFSFVQFASIAAIVSSALAHMDVADPPPLRSKNNPQYKNGNVDFDMTSPLSNDGSNFPCKGYQKDVPSVSTAVATLTPGQQTTVKFEGSASHGGGSCQFSISYDNGKTWGVMHNEVGGCMLAPSVSFTVPSGIPAAKNVLMSWTWFNRIGNREMYQNCMAVDVAGNGTAPASLSKMFEANIGNGCTTKEGMDIDFANPSAGLQDGCSPITPDQKVSVGPSGSSSGGGAAPAPSSSSSSTEDKPTSTDAPSSTATDAPAPTETSAPEDDCTDDGSNDEDCTDDGSDDTDEEDCPPETDTPSSSEPSAPEPTSAPAPEPTSAPAPSPSEAPSTGTGGACTPGTTLCSADGLSWSMCANGEYVKMGAVAPGTKCVDGKHVPARRSPSGYRSHTMRRLEWDH
jgi:hypothetical protein